MDSLDAWHPSSQYQGLPAQYGHMRFNKLDLNLLVALDALLTERNISRAGQRIHLSQPATSNALARLRDYFQDELLIPQGRQLILSARAQELIEPVREVLMRIDSTIATQPTFDPVDAIRKFVLLMSDYSASVFIPTLIERLYKLAPGISLDLRQLDERPLEQLDKSEVDLLIIPSQYVSDLGTRQFLLKNLYWKEQGQLAFRFNLEVFNKEIEQIGTALTDSQRFDKPTLFIRGGNSKYILDDDFQTIQSHFQDSKVETIPNVGHWLHAENPQLFFEIVISFLNT